MGRSDCYSTIQLLVHESQGPGVQCSFDFRNDGVELRDGQQTTIDRLPQGAFAQTNETLVEPSLPGCMLGDERPVDVGRSGEGGDSMIPLSFQCSARKFELWRVVRDDLVRAATASDKAAQAGEEVS